MYIWVITTRIDLSVRQSAVSIITAGYSMTTIEQQLKEEDVIVNKKALYSLINKFMNQLVGDYNLCNNKRPYYNF